MIKTLQSTPHNNIEMVNVHLRQLRGRGIDYNECASSDADDQVSCLTGVNKRRGGGRMWGRFQDTFPPPKLIFVNSSSDGLGKLF